MSNPKLRVKSSGQGGAGYVLPARVGDEFKWVKNADGEQIRARLVDGQKVVVPGTTTVLKQHNKDNLIQWAVNRTLDWLLDNVTVLLQRDPESAKRWGKYRWTDARDERAEIGTAVHEGIEAHLGGEFTLPPMDKEANQAFEQFLDFTKWNKLEPLYLEVTLWDGDSAGTADGIVYVNGLLTLLDWKTSKGTYWSHEMQLGALAKSQFMLIETEDGYWEEVPMPEIEQVAIVHIRPDWYDPDSKTFTPAFWNFKIIPWDEMDLHYRGFCGLREVAVSEKAIKDLRRARSAATLKNEPKEED